MFRIKELIWNTKSMFEKYNSVAIRKTWSQQLNAVDSEELDACSAIIVDLETNNTLTKTGVELCELVSEGRIFQVVEQNDWYFCCCWSEREYQLSKYIDENIKTSYVIDLGDIFRTGLTDTGKANDIAHELSPDVELYTRVLGSRSFKELLLNKSVHAMSAPFYYITVIDSTNKFPRNIGDFILNFRDCIWFNSENHFCILRQTDSGVVMQEYTYKPKMNLELL